MHRIGRTPGVDIIVARDGAGVVAYRRQIMRSLRYTVTSLAISLLIGQALVGCVASGRPNARAPASPPHEGPSSLGWLQGTCLASADATLTPGTPVRVVRLGRPQRVVAVKVEGPARSTLQCKPMLDGRSGLVDLAPAHYYEVNEWSDDPSEMAIGVIGGDARVEIRDGRALVDVNGDGSEALVAACATSEGIRFEVRPAEPRRNAAGAVWTGYYHLDYESEPTCP
jgi:hypothetical protein